MTYTSLIFCLHFSGLCRTNVNPVYICPQCWHTSLLQVSFSTSLLRIARCLHCNHFLFHLLQLLHDLGTLCLTSAVLQLILQLNSAHSQSQHNQMVNSLHCPPVMGKLQIISHSNSKRVMYFALHTGRPSCLQCFDIVDWAPGGASGL